MDTLIHLILYQERAFTFHRLLHACCYYSNLLDLDRSVECYAKTVECQDVISN